MVPIRMLVCAGPQPISAASEFGGRSFEERVKDPKFQEDLGRYLDVLSKEGTIPNNEDPVGFKKFLNNTDFIPQLARCNKTQEFTCVDKAALKSLLLRRHAWFLGRLRNCSTVIVRYHPLRSDVFLWIIDGREAMFLFTYPESNALAFSTRDPALIRVFDEMFTHRWKYATTTEPETTTSAVDPCVPSLKETKIPSGTVSESSASDQVPPAV
jgi:hypothetical protein